MRKLKDNVVTRGLEEVFSIAIPDLAAGTKAIPGVNEVLAWKEYSDRRIVINEAVTEDFMFYSQMIVQWNKEDYENNISIENRQPIKILLYTYGGSVDAAKSFYNIMQISKTPIYVYNMGVCASAGVLIFLSGHKRYAIKGSTFLIHEGEVGLGGQTTKVIENLKVIEKQEKELEEYIISKTNIDKKMYTKNKKKEWWISTEAKELGLIDDFVEDIEELFK